MRNIIHFGIFFLPFIALQSVAETIDGSDDSEQHSNVSQHTVYRTSKERHEDSFGTELTEWLVVHGNIEFEREKAVFNFDDNSSLNEKPPSVKTFQLGFDIDFSESLEGEIVFELENDKKSRASVDESSITWTAEDFSLTFGRYSPAFGKYYSHFIVAPILEFGEVHGTSLAINFSVNEGTELELFGLRSDVDTTSKSNKLDWGLALSWNNDSESVRIGASYLSDIGESEAEFFKEFGRTYQQRVDAISAYAWFGFEEVEISAEMVKTLKKMVELDRDYDQPMSYNLELAYSPVQALQLAVRYEYSEELEEYPESRYGIGMRWLVHNNVSVAINYLKGDYKTFPVDPDDEPESQVTDDTLTVIQISIQF